MHQSCVILLEFVILYTRNYCLKLLFYHNSVLIDFPYYTLQYNIIFHKTMKKAKDGVFLWPQTTPCVAHSDMPAACTAIIASEW